MSDKAKNDRDYSNGEIVVHWRPDAPCVHCEECHKSLPLVFDPKRRPWVILANDTTARICEVVDQCPSGALTWSAAETISKESVQ